MSSKISKSNIINQDYATKEQYDKWQTEVLDMLRPSMFTTSPKSKSTIKKSFANAKCKTIKAPEFTQSIKLMTKHKVIMVFDLILPSKNQLSNASTAMTMSKQSDPQTIKTEKLKLWHIGNQKMDDVKYGYNEEKKQLLYPAIDFGGLTNYRQSLGSKTQFLKPSFSSMDNPTEILSIWLKLSKLTDLGPKDQRELLTSVKKVLDSFQKLKGFAAVIRFVKLPDERRIVAPAEAVFLKTGCYYLRNFGGDDSHYAQGINPTLRKYKTEKGKLFMGVSEDYITPNLNSRNIKLEYH